MEEEEEEEEDSGGFGLQQTAAAETHCGTGGSTQSIVDHKKTDDGATRAGRLWCETRWDTSSKGGNQQVKAKSWQQQML